MTYGGEDAAGSRVNLYIHDVQSVDVDGRPALLGAVSVRGWVVDLAITYRGTAAIRAKLGTTDEGRLSALIRVHFYISAM